MKPDGFEKGQISEIWLQKEPDPSPEAGSWLATAASVVLGRELRFGQMQYILYKCFPKLII
jgi:hypothetical protein